MCKQGRGGEAIATATVMSFFGTVIGVIAMLIMVPLLTSLATKFQSAEYFLLALFGVLICGSLTAPDTPIKGWMAGLLRMGLATIGPDPIHGFQRFTFEIDALAGGIKAIPVILGAFAVPQILRAMMRPPKDAVGPKITRFVAPVGHLEKECFQRNPFWSVRGGGGLDPRRRRRHRSVALS